VRNKWENFEVMLGIEGAPETVEEAFSADQLATTFAKLRDLVFFYLLPSFTLLLLAPVAMLLGYRRAPRAGPEWGFALRCFAVLVVGALFWGLIVFGTPVDGTALHIFSFAVPVLAMAGAIAGLRAMAPRFAIGWVALYAVLSLILYVPALAPLPGTSYSPIAAILAALAVAGYAAVALAGDRLAERLPRLTRAGAAGGASS
jgi:hypothetical protein